LTPSEAYLRQKDPRNEIIMRYAPLVKRVALHLKSRLPPNVQLDDLIQAGMLGLLEASQNYEGGLGASFETYASIRIRGSMIDEIRTYDWTPRSVHRNSRNISDVIRKLSHELGCEPKEADIAKRLGVGIDEYRQMLVDASTSKVIGIDDLGVTDDVIEDSVAQGVMASPHNQLTKLEFSKNLAQAIKDLPEREALIISLYYDEELNLKEIGAVLEISESRACQLLSQSLIRLRSLLSDWLKD
jgi:RNA polymerase sigma factor FliA